MIIYRSDQQCAVVYLPNSYSVSGRPDIPRRRGLLYSAGGVLYHQCIVSGVSSQSSGQSHQHEFTFEVPTLSVYGLTVGGRVKYSSEDDLVRIGGNVFKRTDETTFDDQSVVALPPDRMIVADLVGVVDPTLTIVVDDWIYSDDIYDRRLKHCGVLATVDEYTVFRDGGTSIVKTDRGELYIPTSFNRTAKVATWTDLQGTVHVLKNRE